MYDLIEALLSVVPNARQPCVRSGSGRPYGRRALAASLSEDFDWIRAVIASYDSELCCCVRHAFASIGFQCLSERKRKSDLVRNEVKYKRKK